MKTVKEISLELGVSKVAINNIINDKLSIKEKPKKDEKGRWIITDKDYKNIIKYIKKTNRQKTESHTTDMKLSESYQKVIDNYSEQLKEKDKQIEQLQKLLENQQVLTLQANQKIESLETTQEKKKGFFSKWFK